MKKKFKKWNVTTWQVKKQAAGREKNPNKQARKEGILIISFKMTDMIQKSVTKSF